MAKTIESYRKAESLLIKRINQLERKGRISVHPKTRETIYKIESRDDPSLDAADRFLRHYIKLHSCEGMEETINSTSDWLVRRILQRHKHYEDVLTKQHEKEMAERSRGIGEYFRKLQHAENIAYARIANMRFVG